MNIPWQHVEVFVAVAENGSFSAAARRLRTSQPTVSRRIAALEAVVGKPLFRRDVEGAQLSDEGARLLPAAQQMARFASELERSAAGFEERPAGSVRIASPPGIAFEFLVPFARHFRDRYPEIRIEVLAGIENADLSRGEAELALRNNAPSQGELEALGGVAVPLGVFGSPEYAAAKLGCGPLEPKELDWVTWSYPLEHLTPRRELEAMIEGFEPAFASNDYNVLRRAARVGLGAMILPKAEHPYWPMSDLVEIPTTLPLPSGEVYLVCARSMRWVPRIRAVADALLGVLEEGKGARRL